MDRFVNLLIFKFNKTLLLFFVFACADVLTTYHISHMFLFQIHFWNLFLQFFLVLFNLTTKRIPVAPARQQQASDEIKIRVGPPCQTSGKRETISQNTSNTLFMNRKSQHRFQGVWLRVQGHKIMLVSEQRQREITEDMKLI